MSWQLGRLIVGIGQPENTCQPTNIVDCFTHLSGDSPRVCSKKRRAHCAPVRDCFLGPTWVIRCSTFAQPSDWLGSSISKKERKKVRRRIGGVCPVLAWVPLLTCPLSFFLGFRRPNLITGLSGWRTPNQPLSTHEPVPDRTLILFFFLGFGRPDLITGQSGWRTPDQPLMPGFLGTAEGMVTNQNVVLILQNSCTCRTLVSQTKIPFIKNNELPKNQTHPQHIQKREIVDIQKIKRNRPRMEKSHSGRTVYVQ